MKSQLLQNKRHYSGHAHNTASSAMYVPKGIIPCSLAGTVIAIVLAVLINFIMAAVIYKTADPARYIVPAAFTSLYIAAFTGGGSASRLNGGSALLCGMLCGSIFIATGFMLSLFIQNGASDEYGIIGGLSLRVAIIFCSVFGAFIGTTKKISKNKKRKNHKKR